MGIVTDVDEEFVYVWNEALGVNELKYPVNPAMEIKVKFPIFRIMFFYKFSPARLSHLHSRVVLMRSKMWSILPSKLNVKILLLLRSRQQSNGRLESI